MGNKVSFFAKKESDEKKNKKNHLFISEGHNNLPLYVHLFFDYESIEELESHMELIKDDKGEICSLILKSTMRKPKDVGNLKYFIHRKKTNRMIFHEFMNVTDILIEQKYTYYLDISEYTNFFNSEEEWKAAFIDVTNSNDFRDDFKDDMFQLIGDIIDSDIYKRGTPYYEKVINSVSMSNKYFGDRVKTSVYDNDSRLPALIRLISMLIIFIIAIVMYLTNK